MSEQNELYGTLRSALDTPSSANFKVMISKLMESDLEPELLAQEVIPYVQEKLASWPAHAWRRVGDEQLEDAVRACERGVPLYRLISPLDLRLLGEAFREEHLPGEFGMGTNDIAALREVLTHTYGIEPRDFEVQCGQFKSFFPVWENKYHERFYLHHGNLKLLGAYIPDTNWSTLITITGDLKFEQDGSLSDLQMGIGGDLIARNLWIDAPMAVEGTIKVQHAMINSYDSMLEGNAFEAEVGMWWNARFADTSRVKLPIVFDNAPPYVLPEHVELMKAMLKPELIEQMYDYAREQGAEPDEEGEELYDWLRDELPRIMNSQHIWKS